MPGERNWRPDPDCHIRVPHPPIVEHFPQRNSWEVFLGGSGSRWFAVRNTLVDSPAMGQDLCGRVAAADLVDCGRALALSKIACAERRVRCCARYVFHRETASLAQKALTDNN